MSKCTREHQTPCLLCPAESATPSEYFTPSDNITRFRCAAEQEGKTLKRFQQLLPENGSSQCQNLAWTVLIVTNLLDNERDSARPGRSIPRKGKVVGYGGIG